METSETLLVVLMYRMKIVTLSNWNNSHRYMVDYSYLTAIASEQLDQINYIFHFQQCTWWIPKFQTSPRCLETSTVIHILTQSQAVVDKVCDWESDQDELQPGKRNRSYKQIEEVTQKQKWPISISQTSILSDNSTQSPFQTFMGFWDKEYCQFLGNSTYL